MTIMVANSGDIAAFVTLANGGKISVSAGATLGVGNAGIVPGGPGYVMTPTGTLDELISSATSFGTIDVSGPAALDGILDVTLENGFVPTVGEQFAFLDFTPRRSYRNVRQFPRPDIRQRA